MNRLRTSIAALLCFSLTACYTMQSRAEPLGRIAPSGVPRSMHLTLTDGREVRLHDAAVRGDSILGFDHRYRTTVVATADVNHWKSPRLSVLRTLAVVVAVGAVLSVLLLEPQQEPVYNVNVP